MPKTNLEIFVDEFAESIPLTITVEVFPEHLAGDCTITRVLPVDGTSKPTAVVLFSGYYKELIVQIERILSDPILAYIEAGWNPQGVKVIEKEEEPDLSKFAGKKNIKDIGLGDL